MSAAARHTLQAVLLDYIRAHPGAMRAQLPVAIPARIPAVVAAMRVLERDTQIGADHPYGPFGGRRWWEATDGE